MAEEKNQMLEAMYSMAADKGKRGEDAVKTAWEAISFFEKGAISAPRRTPDGTYKEDAIITGDHFVALDGEGTVFGYFMTNPWASQAYGAHVTRLVNRAFDDQQEVGMAEMMLSRKYETLQSIEESHEKKRKDRRNERNERLRAKQDVLEETELDLKIAETSAKVRYYDRAIHPFRHTAATNRDRSDSSRPSNT